MLEEPPCHSLQFPHLPTLATSPNIDLLPPLKDEGGGRGGEEHKSATLCQKLRWFGSMFRKKEEKKMPQNPGFVV